MLFRSEKGDAYIAEIGTSNIYYRCLQQQHGRIRHLQGSRAYGAISEDEQGGACNARIGTMNTIVAYGTG